MKFTLLEELSRYSIISDFSNGEYSTPTKTGSDLNKKKKKKIHSVLGQKLDL